MNPLLPAILFPFAVGAIALEPNRSILNTTLSPAMHRWMELRREMSCTHWTTGSAYCRNALNELDKLEQFIRISGNEAEIRLLDQLSGKYHEHADIRTWGQAAQAAAERGCCVRAILVGRRGAGNDVLYESPDMTAGSEVILLHCYQKENGEWNEAGQSVINALDAIAPGLGDAVRDGGCTVSMNYACYGSCGRKSAPAAGASPACGTVVPELPKDFGLSRSEVDLRHPYPVPAPAGTALLPEEGRNLLEAIRQGDAESVSRMVKGNPQLLRGFGTESMYLRPLAYSVRLGNAATTRALLEAGASPNERDAYGHPAILECLSPGHVDVERARMLLEAGANPDALFPTPRDGVPASLLQRAASSKDAVLLLLQYGAHPKDADLDAIKAYMPDGDLQEVLEIINDK